MSLNNSQAQQRTLAQYSDNYSKSRLMDELDRNPADVIARFRRIHSEASEPPSLSPPTSFGLLIVDLAYAIASYSSKTDEDGMAARSVALVDIGLVEAFVAVVETENFFLWPLIFRAKILCIISGVVAEASVNPGARERICLTTTTLFRSIWSRHVMVRVSDPGIRHKGGETDDTTMLPDLVDAYYEVYRICDRAPGLETCIHHVHLLVWVLSREEDGVPSIKFHEMLATSLYSAWGPSLQTMQEAQKTFRMPELKTEYLEVQQILVEDAIVYGLGSDRLIDACEIKIRGFLDHLGCNCENGVHDIRAFGRRILSSAPLMANVHRRDLLRQSLDVLKQLKFVEEFGTGMCTSLFLFCAYLTMVYRVYSNAGRVPLAAPHRHPDVVDLYVIGMELAAAGSSATVSQGDLQGTVVEGLKIMITTIETDIESMRKAGTTRSICFR